MGHEKLPIEIDKRSGYDITDLVRLFLLVSKRPEGRTVLVRKLHLGEATVKTMMKFLKKNGLIEQTTKGIRPSEKMAGMFSFCSLFSGLSRIEVSEISEKPTAVLIVRDSAGMVRSGIEQRDEGVKFGSDVITLVRRGGKLVLAGVPDHALPYTKMLEKLFDIREKDVVIVSSADSILNAERGAVAAGLKVVSDS